MFVFSNKYIANVSRHDLRRINLISISCLNVSTITNSSIPLAVRYKFLPHRIQVSSNFFYTIQKHYEEIYLVNFFKPPIDAFKGPFVGDIINK